MIKRFLLCLIGLFLLGSLFANVFPLHLHLDGYYPVLDNKVLFYKFDKGIGYIKQRQLLVNNLAPTTREKIDFDNRQVVISTLIDDKKVTPDRIISFDSYFASLQRKAFRKSYFAQVKTKRQQTVVTTSGLIGEFKLELPSIAMPKAVKRFLGSSAGRLNLDGTQKLTLEVGSTKRKLQPIYETSSKSRFDLKMEQETNLRLTGKIGDKIDVNLKYNSKLDEQFFDPNNVSIKYTGTEDELVQSVEAGNITLSLSGSRYISYSTSSQGLFGVSSKLKYGDLDVTLIASKEESQKNTQSYIGTSQADSTIFDSKQYATRTMFYLEKPQDLYQLYEEGDPDCKTGYANNAIRTAPDGAWLIKEPMLLPAPGTVKVYIDDLVATNNVGAAPGEIIRINGQNYQLNWDELMEGADFTTDYDSGIIQINRNVLTSHIVGVRYTTRGGVDMPIITPQQAESDTLYAKIIRNYNQQYEPDNPNSTWDYQMRNVYQMTGTNIRNDGFELEIYTENTDRTRNFFVPDSLNVGQNVRYTDYLRMDSNGDSRVDGSDATVNLVSGHIIIPMLWPFEPLGDGIIYRLENDSYSINPLDTDIFLTVKGKIGRDVLELNQANILKGSVRVKVNSLELKENLDYLVDYDTGRITFLTPAGKDPDAKIEVDYEFRGMFDVASKTLAGVRMDWNFTDWAKLGGTFIYRSENVADKRPRIGNENIEMMLANIDGNITVRPKFVTRWIDKLPLISTSAESRFNLSGEIAYTMPNIYGDPKGKKNNIYLDDMESIMDSYPLPITMSSWVMASKPYGFNLAKGIPNWYNPKNVRRQELVDDPETLTEREKNEYVTVLALKNTPTKLGVGGSTQQSWAGVMKYLGNQLDFNQKKYIELLVKVDVKTDEEVPNPIMFVDLGDISEDFYTENGGLGVLNTEDLNGDGVLTLEEDIGLDGRKQGTPGADPNDICPPVLQNHHNESWPGINGTEGNRVLDTEDLNGNGILDQVNRYFSYSFALNGVEHLVNENHSGWRLYRIPLHDPAVYNIITDSATGVQPSMSRISYARIWLQTDLPARVYIADMAIVGNKWQDFGVRTENNQELGEDYVASLGTTYLSGIVTNQTSSHYKPPEGTVYIEDRRQSVESSLTLETKKLQPGHQVLLRQRSVDAYSLLSYGKLRLFVYPEALRTGESHPSQVDMVLRLGADEFTYYEIKQRVDINPWEMTMDEDKWLLFTWELSDIAKLREANPDTTSGFIQVDENTRFSFRGRPTLSTIRDICLGVANPRGNQVYNGMMYFDELQLLDPYEDVGVAKRVSLNAAFADVSTLDIDYEEKSENFNPNIQRGRSNTFTSTTSLNISNKYFLGRLFPRNWSVEIPVTLVRNYSLGIPRFRANSDLLRSSIEEDSTKMRERNESLLYAADVAFSLKSAPRSKILEYTIYRTSLSGRIESSVRNQPTSRDSTFSVRGTVNYNLGFPSDKVSFKLWKNYRLGWFPSTWNNSITFNSTNPRSENWERRMIDGQYVTYWFPRQGVLPTKLLTTDSNINWALTSDIGLTGRLNTKRDFNQKHYWKEVNIGKITEYVQDLGVNYNPNYLRRFMTFTASANTRYNETQRRYYDNTTGTQVEVYQSDGGVNRGVRANLSLQNSTLLGAWAQSITRKYQARKAVKEAKKREAEMQASEAPEGKEEKFEDKDFDREAWEKEMLDKGEDLSEEEKMKLEEEYKKRMEDEEMRKKEEEFWSEPPKDDYKDPFGGDYKDPFGGDYKDPYGDKDLFGDDFGDYKDPFGDGADGKDGMGFGPGASYQGGDPGRAYVPPKGVTYLPALLIGYLSKIKNITASYQNTYTMNYTRKEDRPPFGFQIGLPHTVPSDFLDATGNDNTFTLSSGIMFTRQLDSVINYSYAINKRYSNASNQNTAVTFPDITLSILEAEKWVGLGNIISGSRINTGFQKSYRASGNIDWDQPKQETVSYALNPLIGFAGTLFKKVSTNLSFSMMNSTNTTDMETYDIVKLTSSYSLNGNISYSFKGGRGFTVPFTKKKIHINNELTSSLAFVFEKNLDDTTGREGNHQIDRDTTRLAFTPGATYQFNQDIRGGLTGTYEITSDKRRDDGLRTFRLGVWVEINL